ncbi:MAG: leucine-rich repeat protein [Prevotella sp.]|nr:leucine-rich repeat protein [Prevotella sp.]
MKKSLFVLVALFVSAWTQQSVVEAAAVAPDGAKPSKSEANLKEYVDETYNIVYTYDPDGTTAQVKAGSGNVTTGSPLASGDIIILDKFTAEGKEYTVTEIGASAFIYCSITSAYIPASVKIIGTDAFRYCPRLKNVEIAEGVEVIRDLAFADCDSLTTARIPASVNLMEIHPFCNCKNLAEIVVDENNASYDSRNNCNAIIEKAIGRLVGGCKNSTIPQDVKIIGWGAFMSMPLEGEIVLPEGLTSVGAYAFQSTLISKVSLPESLEEISWEAFSYCENLHEATIPKNVRTFGWNVFGNTLNSLTSLIEEPFEVREDAFSNLSNCTLFVPEESLEQYKNTKGWQSFKRILAIGSDPGEDKEYIDPSTNVVYTYNTLESTAAVKQGTNNEAGSPDASGDITILEKIIDGDKEYTVCSVGDYAFCRNYNITGVTLPNTVTTIGRSAFSNSGLLTISLPADLERIEPGTFSYTRLKNVQLPEKLKYIGTSAFTATELTTVFIPSEVSKVETGAFVRCNKIASFVVSDENPVYDSRDNCNALIETATNTLISGFVSTTIPSSVVRIGESAFQESNIEEVEIPDGVTDIDRMAFFSASWLHTVQLPESLVNIGDQVFTYFNCLRELTIPDGVKSIGNRCFSQSGLESFSFPLQVEIIESSMFEYCPNLLSVTIPSSVNQIYSRAFYHCTALRGLICMVDTPIDIENNVFSMEDGSFSTAKLYVPENSVELYKNASEWKNFQQVIAYTDGLEIGKVYVDPETNIAYVYDSDRDCASVKGGSYSQPGSVVVGEEAHILDAFTVGGKEYHVDEIAGYALSGEFTKLTIPATVNKIRDCAFNNCWWNITNVEVLSRVPVDITEDVFNYSAYSRATLHVPAGTKELYEQAAGWKNFQSIAEMERDVNMPIEFADAKVKRICVENWDANGDGELSYAEAATVEDIGTAFSYNQEITSFDEFQHFTGITSLPSECFAICSELQSIIIPKNVTSVKHDCFNSCVKLNTISVDADNAVYDSRDNCNAIIQTSTNTLIRGSVSTTIPNTVVHIGNNAFFGSEIESINIPSSVVSIGNVAFWNCYEVTELYIPESVVEIGIGLTCYCTSLQSVEVDENNPVYDSRGGCNAIMETSSNRLIASCGTSVIPESTKIIGNASFYGNKAVKDIILPYGVENVEGEAFELTPYETLIIPESVVSIGNQAFRALPNISKGEEVSSIHCFIKNPFAISDDVFNMARADMGDSIYHNTPLYVPAGTKELYEQTDGWKKFQNIVEMEPETIEPIADGEEQNFSEKFDEDTDLDGTVIDNVYYAISPEDGSGYDADEQCIILNRNMTDEEIEQNVLGLIVGSDELNREFSGIIFEVPAGSGVVSVTMQTRGTSILKVKFGNQTPYSISLEGGKMTGRFPYNVSVPTYVYIYAGAGAGAVGSKRNAPSAAENSVMLYGFSHVKTGEYTPTGINNVVETEDQTPAVYNMQGQRVSLSNMPKGIHVVGGRKVVVR